MDYIVAMRCAILLTPLLLSPIAHAQSWSPPGATWTYSLQDWGITGYSRYTYVGDTLLNDTIGQRIDLEEVVVFEPEPTPVVNTHVSAVITSYANDVVSVWDQLSERWDTLFWFGAGVNDFWQPPHYEGECGDAERITVEDTGTLEEEGITLRWLDLANDRGRIIERAGWFWNLELTPSCLIVEGLAGQRCYSDDQITYSPPTWTAECFAIGMSEQGWNDAFLLYPDPGIDEFTIRLPVGSATMLIRDALGRIAKKERVSGGTVVVDTAALPAGPYSIFLVQGTAAIPAGTWIKY